jgi:hypothetical protein
VEQWTSGLFVLSAKKDVQNEQKPSFSLESRKRVWEVFCSYLINFRTVPSGFFWGKGLRAAAGTVKITERRYMQIDPVRAAAAKWIYIIL